MKKREGQFETVPVEQALRAAMKHAGNKLHEGKSEPYATAINLELSARTTNPDSNNGRNNAALCRAAETPNPARR